MSFPRSNTDDKRRSSRRACEFSRYIRPYDLIHPDRGNEKLPLDFDGIPSLSVILAPLCQLTALRCNVKKAMINCMDRDVMYFLTEATTQETTVGGAEVAQFIHDPILASCTAVPLKGRICELTIHLEDREDRGTPFFVVSDLSKSQFAHMSMISGPPYYRFYAGTPIRTDNGVNIGSLAIMDCKPRQGLTRAEESFLGTTAAHIMALLKTHRLAFEGVRTRKMMNSLKDFIAGPSLSEQAEVSSPQHVSVSADDYAVALPCGDDLGPFPSYKTSTFEYPEEVEETKTTAWQYPDTLPSPSFVRAPPNIKTTAKKVGSRREILERAADLIARGLDLHHPSSVTFFSLSNHTRVSTSFQSGTSEHSEIADRTAIEHQKHFPAVDVGTTIPYDLPPNQNDNDARNTLENDFLRWLSRKYPKGCLWNLDMSSSNSSDEELLDDTDSYRTSHGISTAVSKQTPLERLQGAFPMATQILFVPLYSPASERLSHCLFVESNNEHCRFDAGVDLSFLHAFSTTVVAGLGRFEALLLDKQKSDFVGTISHELRSPLHGVLACIDFLHDSKLTNFQQSMINTIEKCGRTLLDTMNHVLDHSKINAFEKQWNASKKKSRTSERYHSNRDAMPVAFTTTVPALLQISAVTDISVILEEVLDSLILGRSYDQDIDLTDISSTALSHTQEQPKRSGPIRSHPDNLQIVLSIENVDWSFMTQPGAIRRIIMNLAGNALKYTSEGVITLSLSQRAPSNSSHDKRIVLTVSDTGPGITPSFLDSKLFVPFSQENTLTPGTGLGLSIVHSIVSMLGGEIELQSVVAKGTTVSVELPVKRPMPEQTSAQNTPQSGLTESNESPVLGAISQFRLQHTGVFISFFGSLRSDNTSCPILGSYITEWFQASVVDSCEDASVVILAAEDLDKCLEGRVGHPKSHKALVVLYEPYLSHDVLCYHDPLRLGGSTVEFITTPCGPHKLAKALNCVIEKQKSSSLHQPQHIQSSPLEAISSRSTISGCSSFTEELSELDMNEAPTPDLLDVVRVTKNFVVGSNGQLAPRAFQTLSTKVVSPSQTSQSSDDLIFPPSSQGEYRRLQLKRKSGGEVIDPTKHSLWTSIQGEDTEQLHQSDPAKPLRPSRESTTTNYTKVLIVDDNMINLRLLETYLRGKRRYTNVLKAMNGHQAVDVFIEATLSSRPFDLIFMDISMPIMNGFDATRNIRQYEEKQRVRKNMNRGSNCLQAGAFIIALTGLASGKDQAEGFCCGFDLYMTKPVSFKEVSEVLDNWEAQRIMSL